jgi:hypothetical protein
MKRTLIAAVLSAAALFLGACGDGKVAEVTLEFQKGYYYSVCMYSNVRIGDAAVLPGVYADGSTATVELDTGKIYSVVYDVTTYDDYAGWSKYSDVDDGPYSVIGGTFTPYENRWIIDETW